MAKMTRGEEAAIYLRQAFGAENFSFEQAKEYLASTNFAIGGQFVKQSWNSMIKRHILAINDDGTAYLMDDNDDENEGPINSTWTNEHRKHFICEQNNNKSGFGDFFTKEDLPALNKIYHNWKEQGELYQYYGCRRANLPEVISEGLPSALFGWARTNNLHLVNIENSADLVDVITGDAIQVKGASVYGDGDGGPTSFGPKTKFDRLIVMHIRLDEDKAYFYELNAQEYKDWKVNGQMSLREQQEEGRRPRLLLLPIIREQQLVPFSVYNFNASTD
jgi:hypothetical protein